MKDIIFPYRLFARLEHKGETLGYRFSRGFSKEYVDFTLNECSIMFGHPIPEIKRQLERSGQMWYHFPYWSTEGGLAFYAGYVSGSRKILVDEEMKPLKEWNDTVKIHRLGGIEAVQPVKSVHQTLSVVKAMDNLLYGTDFQERFQIMSVNSVEIVPQLIVEGKPLPTLGNSTVNAGMFSAFNINAITEDEIMSNWEIFCVQNGIKNIAMTCTPLKKIYLLTLEAHDIPIVPTKAPMPEFINAVDIPVVSASHYSTARRKHKLNYCGYTTADGSIYRFSSADDVTASGCTIKDSSFVPYNERTKKYFFHRLMVCGNDIYEMSIAKANNWVKTVGQSALPIFIRGVERLMQETVLDDYLLSESCNLPSYQVQGKTCILSLFKDVDLLEEFGPINYLAVTETIQQEWVNNTDDWEDYDWKYDVRAVEPEIIWHDKSVELRLLVTI